jgi:hypothetical protein
MTVLPTRQEFITNFKATVKTGAKMAWHGVNGVIVGFSVEDEKRVIVKFSDELEVREILINSFRRGGSVFI